MSRFSPRLADLALALGFFSRVPAPRVAVPEGRPFSASFWAVPLVGALVALLSGGAFALAHLAGLGPHPAALLALAAALLLTGAFHEDGLADTADAFGGGATRERKLAIMHDSRIGTFGAAALLLALLLRATALAEIAAPGAVLLALLAAHGASRALLPLFLAAVPPAREAGLGARVGAVPRGAVPLALLLGLLALLPLGALGAALGVLLLALLLLGARRLALRQIGGQTGDVCGALQQVAETALLLLAATRLA